LAAACYFPTDLQGSGAGELGNGNSLRRVKDIQAELLMVWGRQDPHIPYEGRQAIYRALHEAGMLFTWHEFNAEHAFMRDEGARYDPAATRLGLGLAFDLYQRVL
jgi:carboxymethylenebutenolidase